MKLDDFLATDYWQAYDQSIRSSLSYSPCTQDRCRRVHEAAEHGCEGSTHGEIIGDWQDAIKGAYRDEEITEEQRDQLMKEVDKCWDWHAKNGSIDQEEG